MQITYDWVTAMGRSYCELDILFENKVPAWRFSKTKVDRKFLFIRV